MGKKDTKKKDESKETKSKKKKKDDVPLVHINGNAGKENEGFDEEEEEKHNIDKAKKKKISKPEQLCAAAYSGQKEDVEKLLDKGVDINYRDEYGKSPLHHATSGKQHQIVELLLRRGADVTLQDQRGDTPLHAAVRAGDEPSVKTLLSNERCNVSAEGRSLCTPLHIACGMDKLSICRVLVDHNASITAKDEDQMTPLGHSVEKGARRTAAYMFEVADSQLGETEPLLYDADSDGSTLLHMAVDSGVTEIVEMCLKHGARVREPKKTDKTTAFHVACSQGPVEMVRLLVDKDPVICRICLIDKNGMSGLHRAAVSNQRDIVAFLLDHGASVDLPDKSRRTPLFMAASSGATETVELLIERGANITAKNVGMKTVLHSAVGHDNAINAILKVNGDDGGQNRRV